MIPSALKILFASRDKFPPFRVDVAVLFGQELVAKGHRIDWVLQSQEDCRRAYRTTWAGGRVWVGTTDNGSRLIQRARKHWRRFMHMARCTRLLKKGGYDIVQVKDSFFSAFAFLLAAKRQGVPFFYWLSYPVPEALLYAIKEGTARYPVLYFLRGSMYQLLLYRLILRYADHIFVQSEQMRKDLCIQGIRGDRMTPVPMGITPELIHPLPATGAGHRPTEHPMLVYLGTLIRVRRIDFIIRVLGRVRAAVPGVRLYLVGKGESQEDTAVLRQEADRLGINEAVVFTGFLDRRQAIGIVADADVCLSPFFPAPVLNSTSPTKLIEYMALGKAVVGNDHPEQKWILEASGGGICTAYDEAEFADAIIHLLKHPEVSREMGQKGRQWVLVHRNYAKIAETVENSYQKFKFRYFPDAIFETDITFPAACCGVSERIKNRPKSLPGRFPVACDGESFNATPPIRTQHSRFAYIKNGDVVAEVQALGRIDEDILGNGGPAHYIGSFMQWAAGAVTLFISRHMADKQWSDGRGRVTAKVFNTLSSRSRITKAFLELRAFGLILYDLLVFKPDWILCAVEGGGPMTAGFLNASLRRIPFVHTRHMRLDTFRPSVFKKMKMKMDHWIIRHADYVLCNGPYLEDQLIQIGVCRKKLIPFGLPYKDIGRKSGAWGPSDAFRGVFKGCTLVYVGRIEEKKGALDLLLACHVLLAKDSAINLLYVGDGRLLETVKKKSIELGLTRQVHFVGQQPHDTTVALMRRSDILIIPTRQELGEGRCKSAIEALILGLPIIAPDYGAFRYLIRDNENGLFYEPDNIDDLRRKIRQLVYSVPERKRMSDQARRDGCALVDPERTFIGAVDMAFHRAVI